MCVNMFLMCLGDCPLPSNHPAVSQLPALRPDPHHYPTIDEPLPPSEFPRLTTHKHTDYWKVPRVCINYNLKSKMNIIHL